MTTLQTTQETKKESMNTEIDDSASIATSTSSMLSDIDISGSDISESELKLFSEQFDRMTDSPEDLEIMWSPPYPPNRVPYEVNFIDLAARNRWRQIMIARMENKEEPIKWPKRSEFPERMYRTTQDEIDAWHDEIEAAGKAANARLAEESRRALESKASDKINSRPLTATVSRSEMQTAAVTTTPSAITVSDVGIQCTLTSPGTSAQAAVSQAAVLEKDAESHVVANGQSPGLMIMDNAEPMEHPEGSAFQDHDEPDESIMGSIIATASDHSGNSFIHEAVDDSGDNSSVEPHAEGQPAVVNGPVDEGRPQTGWR